MPDPSPQRIEIGVVLQGGGALGAYEYGAITTLLELIEQATGRGLDVTLSAVTGVSIGAINAACVVGSANRIDARRRLAALWNDLVLETPMFWPLHARRDLALYGLPHFYSPRSDVWSFSSWTYLYDTHPLAADARPPYRLRRAEQEQHDLRGHRRRRRERRAEAFLQQQRDKTELTVIEPHHVLASGSLPPQFPWTDIKEGGKVRALLGWRHRRQHAADRRHRRLQPWPRRERLLVVINLFPQDMRDSHPPCSR